jgi:hypothetical protein
VPLWWIWQNLPAGPAIRSIGQFWSATPTTATPAWVDLQTNEVAPYSVSPGMIAIIRLMRLAVGDANEIPPPSVETVTNYYDAGLVMLSHMANKT